MPDTVRIILADKLTENAENKFQYIFQNYPISDVVEQNTNPDIPINIFQDFINSNDMLDFVRVVTKISNITFADCQATLFQTGHFLKCHNDNVGGKNRLIAYVFNFTKKWDVDFGGILQFIDSDGHIEEGYTPTFNSLNLFKIPMNHSVSYITPYAKVGRYSITGWFRK